MILNIHTNYAHEQLKLHRDAGPAEGRIVGRPEHVDSGQQFQFNSVEELIACLAGHAASIGKAL